MTTERFLTIITLAWVILAILYLFGAGIIPAYAAPIWGTDDVTCGVWTYYAPGVAERAQATAGNGWDRFSWWMLARVTTARTWWVRWRSRWPRPGASTRRGGRAIGTLFDVLTKCAIGAILGTCREYQGA